VTPKGESSVNATGGRGSWPGASATAECSPSVCSGAPNSNSWGVGAAVGAGLGVGVGAATGAAAGASAGAAVVVGAAAGAESEVVT
jgi:hypothetical protein